MKKKAFTLIELLIVISIIWLLIIMLLPKLNDSKMLAEDVKRKSFVAKISNIITIAQSQWKELIPTVWAGGCFQEYLPDIIAGGYASNLSVIRDTVWNITYWTKVNGCNGDFWIARTKDWAYVVVWHLIWPKAWNYILPKTDYKTRPYFVNTNYFWTAWIDNKTCVSVKQWTSNTSCDLIWKKTEWLYNNPNLKVYIQTAWY